MPLFSYVLQLPAGSLFCVEVSKDRNELVPCYQHITNALTSGKRVVTEDIRARTKDHIATYVARHRLRGVEIDLIEKEVSILSNRQLQIYKKLLDAEPHK